MAGDVLCKSLSGMFWTWHKKIPLGAYIRLISAGITSKVAQDHVVLAATSEH